MGCLLHFGGIHGHTHGDVHGHSHGEKSAHNHPESDDSDAIRSLSNRNINIRSALIHVIGDLVQSVGVFIAAVLIYCNVSDFR